MTDSAPMIFYNSIRYSPDSARQPHTPRCWQKPSNAAIASWLSGTSRRSESGGPFIQPLLNSERCSRNPQGSMQAGSYPPALSGWKGMLFRERLHGSRFVVLDVEHGVELGDLQEVVHLLGKVQQLE